MPVGDIDFCQHYQARQDIESVVDTDPADFYVRYRRWRSKDPLPGAPAEMLLYFLEWSTSEQMLQDGADGATQGGVLNVHCPYFNDFVAWSRSTSFIYSVDELREYGIEADSPHVTGRSAGSDFEVALRRYFQNASLNPYETALINGTIIAKSDLSSTPGGSGSDHRLFVVPGFLALELEQDLSDVTWGGVESRIDQAFAITGHNLINLSGAVQLRLGDKGTSTFNPIDVAPGFVVLGRI
jgi:hypothetical protein